MIDNPLPSLSSPPSPRHSRATRLVAVFVLLVFLLGGVVWYTIKNKAQPLASPPRQVFSPKTQFVPKGTTPLEVDQALAAFGFPKPLPFFDKDNVVQSLDVKKPYLAEASTSQQSTTSAAFSTDIYLSYRIEGQSMTTIHDTYVDYLQNIGLGKNIEWKQKEHFELFLPHDPPLLLRLSLLEQPFAGTKDHEVITVVLRLTSVITNPQQ